MYTKGEWKVAIARYTNALPSIHIYHEEATTPIVGYGHGRVICDIANTDSPEAEDNAHLIAAAPELYEALKYARAELLEFIEDNYGDTDLFEIHFKQLHPIDEALAKVEVK